jgi:hypothetical protein
MLQRIRVIGISLLTMAMFALIPAGSAQNSKNGAPTPLTPSAPQDLSRPHETSAILYSDPEAPGILDSRPLSGVQKLTLGMTPARQSFLLPSFTVMTQVQSNPYSSGQNGGRTVGSSTYLTGRLGLNRVTPASAILLDYLGGGTFSQGLGQSNSMIQSLDFSSTLTRGRWSLTAGDVFSYLSQSPFGFGGLGGLNGFGVPLGNGVGTSPGFNSGIAPDQTIFLDGQRQLRNAVVCQLGYELSRRSTMTFAGTYDVQNFIDSGLQNGNTATFSSGYNYLLSRQDTIAFSYSYSMFLFSRNNPSFSDHTGMLSYARRISGRLSFQIGAGPQVQIFDSALAGPGRVVSWALATSTDYQYGDMSTSLTYSHGLSGGSGVLRGSETDTVQGTVSRTIGKRWNTSVGVGYSRNAALEQTARSASSIAPQTWYGTASLNRRFLGYGGLFLAYTASKQSRLSALCGLPACGAGATTHTGSIGYTWGTRPIVLR